MSLNLNSSLNLNWNVTLKKWARGSLCLLVFFFLPSALGGNSFPRICGIRGHVQFDENRKTKFKVNDVLHETFEIQTEPKSLLCVDLSAEDRLIVGPETRLVIPGRDGEKAKTEELILRGGQFRLWKASQESTFVASELFRLEFGKGDFVLSYVHQKAEASLRVLGGEADFRGLENEVAEHLRAGQEISFQGELQDDQVQYDVLLQGKKVARGHLLPKSELSQERMEILSQELNYKGLPPVIQGPRSKGRKSSAKRSATASSGEDQPTTAAESKASKESKDSLEICRKPRGRFGQCQWICEHNRAAAKTCEISRSGVRCVRLRCDANGRWSDRFEYSAATSPCARTPIVKECDY